MRGRVAEVDRLMRGIAQRRLAFAARTERVGSRRTGAVSCACIRLACASSARIDNVLDAARG